MKLKTVAVHASAWADCVLLQMSSAGRPQHMATPRPPRAVYRAAPVSQNTQVINMRAAADPFISALNFLAAPRGMYMRQRSVVQQAVKRRKMVIERYRDVGTPVVVKLSTRAAVTPISAIAKRMRRKYMIMSIILVV